VRIRLRHPSREGYAINSNQPSIIIYHPISIFAHNHVIHAGPRGDRPIIMKNPNLVDRTTPTIHTVLIIKL
jgi:hypothetical protein